MRLVPASEGRGVRVCRAPSRRARMRRFDPVEAQVNFPELEHRVLEFWREADVFRRQLAASEGKPEWVFYDGPPTANARPHIGHAVTRTFKDIFPRFKTMTGHYVHRKAGWDCHGLPVEIEVEKEIGTTGKRDDEALVGTSLLVWTTTPWTLPANEGAAVDSSADYVVVELEGEHLIVGADLRAATLGDDGTVIRTLKGADLLGARYRPPYPNVP